MKITTNKFKSADFDPWVLKQLVDDYEPGDAYGYVLVDEYMVPYPFIERLCDHVGSYMFDYGPVLTLEEICGSEFWQSLDENERRVVGPCLLIIIENGLAVPIPD